MYCPRLPARAVHRRVRTFIGATRNEIVKIANIDGRAHVVTASGGVDIEVASQGRFPADNQRLIARIVALREWYASSRPSLDPSLDVASLQSSLSRLGPPVPAPGQIFAIGINYRAHGTEVAMNIPAEPMVFTKFQSSLAGPGAVLELPTATVDWEVELVVVISAGGRHIPASAAMSHVAGYCVGQDISERTLQMAARPPQFSLAKSFAGFAPIGPWLTTADEVDVSGLQLLCKNGGEVLQQGNTGDMIFNVPTLVAYLSSVCELRTGDIVFSGTPDGVGFTRKPPRFLADGWLLESSIEGLGHLANPCVKSHGRGA